MNNKLENMLMESTMPDGEKDLVRMEDTFFSKLEDAFNEGDKLNDLLLTVEPLSVENSDLMVAYLKINYPKAYDYVFGTYYI